MRNKGFTLVEMAIVLIIVGVMTAGGVKMIYSAMDTNKFTNSRNQIESIVKEIAEFSGRARRIPADFAELSNIVTPLTDAFEQTILYTPANGITGNTANICNVDSTTITVKQCVDAGCTSSTDHENVAFVVTSGSINENIQVTDSTIDYLIYEDGITIDGHTADINRSENYDDLVSWLTLDALKKFAGCTGSAIQIIEDMIPSAYSESTYSTQLHPLGGVGPYKWCIESDEAEIQENFFYSTNTINNIDGCTGNYITAPDTITINTNNIVLDSATDTFPPNSKVRVFLQDNNGVQTSKEFSLNVKQPYELVLNDMNGTPTSPLTSEVTNASDFVVSATGGNGNGNGNAIIAVSNTEIEILLNTNVTSAYIFNNCNANPNAADACPAFGNHGLLSAYFTLDYQEKNNAPTPMGFTFAVIKSYIAGTTYTRAPNTLGGADDGLGYGGSGGDEIGMQGGNSFAVEFDLHKNNEKNDINNDHIAIVSFANKNNYDESYDDTTGISNNDQTYTSYGNNIHTSIGTPTNWVMTFNTEC
ncbi:MAG: hypothetical protein C0603_00690 [Denitrovibrio sp.]|nr:MAG: hypothetical protein C0603_00690 [Denitrovibrio sp.]